jgi:hypothetical protein
MYNYKVGDKITLDENWWKYIKPEYRDKPLTIITIDNYENYHLDGDNYLDGSGWSGFAFNLIKEQNLEKIFIHNLLNI